MNLEIDTLHINTVCVNYTQKQQIIQNPFPAKGHVTYPPLNLIPGTLQIAEIERAGKNQ